MPTAQLLQTNFNAGEWTSELAGRVDLAKYANSCATLKNFIPKIEGPALKRSGSIFLKEVKDSAAATRLIPFEFSNTQAYVLEFGNLYFRVFRDGGAVLETAQNITGLTNATPRVVTIVGHGYANGDEVFITGTSTELDDRYWIVAAAAANTFELTGSTVGTVWAAGGTAARTYTVTTPYATADLFALQVVQSADTMYVAHPNYAPRKITRTGHTSWTVTEIDFDWPPFRDENTTATTLSANLKTGVGITITASANTFVAGDVGRVLRFRELSAATQIVWESTNNLDRNNVTLAVGDYCQYQGNVYQLTNKNGAANCGHTPPTHLTGTESDGKWSWLYIHSGEGYAEITAFVSATQVTATVISQLPNGVTTLAAPPATTLWAWGAWDTTSGFPRSVTLYEDRLWWAGTSADPQAFWGSRSGDYENHRGANDDTGALLFFLSTDDVNAIEWIHGGKVLQVGTGAAEFACSGANVDEPISRSNPMRAVIHATNGSKAGMRPIVVGNAALFVQRGGQRIRELVFDFASDSFVAQDLTLLASHLVRGGVKDWSWHAKPLRLVWAACDDGVAAVGAYDRQQDVVGFAKVEMGGVFGSGAPVIESFATIPHWDGDEDVTFAVVKRTINGATKRYVEYFGKPWRDNFAEADQIFLDSALTFTGAGATISGLWHLIGQTVGVVADGAYIGDFVVSAAGQITGLSPAVSAKAQIGLRYTADLEPQRPEYQTREGTAQGRVRRVGPVVVRVWETGEGLELGPDSAHLQAVRWTARQQPGGAALGLYTGDTEPVSITPALTLDGKLFIRHNKPLACAVQIIAQRVSLGD
jgi:hypothetical protein